MKKPVIGVVDYGAGNCNSVRSIVSALGYRSRLVRTSGDFEELSLIVIPGVGAFPTAMRSLDEKMLTEPIKEHVASGLPLIGVCLGMQLLAEYSEEHGGAHGLGILPGVVSPLTSPRWNIGWEQLVSERENWGGFTDETVYFNHSFEFKTSSEFVVATTTQSTPIISVVENGGVVGFQFHPEKSQEAGKRIMGRTIEKLIHG